MDSQLPSNQEPQQNQITPEQLQQMKMMARQQAMQQVIQQRQAEEQQKIVYVRRNLTIAEIVLLLVVSCLLGTGVQFGWKLATDFLPRVEIKVN